VTHLLQVLDRDIGSTALRAAVSAPMAGLRVAAHYGCHALRPSQTTRFDDPQAPTIFEDLLAAAGGVPVSWTLRLECCGQPLAGKNDRLSLALAASKYESALQAGADVLVTACTYCQMQLGAAALSCALPSVLAASGPRPGPPIAVVHVSRLLGAAMGLWPLGTMTAPRSDTG
jgi:heterodisulfide reductase subunit B